MKKDSVYVIFDRKKKVQGDELGFVEVVVYLNRSQRKYISVGKSTRDKWEAYAKSKEVREVINHCKEVLAALAVLKLEVNFENFTTYYNKGGETASAEPSQSSHLYNGFDLNGDFLAYMAQDIENQDIREGTRKHKRCTLAALKRWGKIKTFADLVPSKILAFDQWLHDGTRTDVSIYTYHKNLRNVIRRLKMADKIPSNPYERVPVKRGKCKVRKPLTENELDTIMSVRLDGKLSRVRDLFVFSAYTGLSYADVMAFEFDKAAVKEGKMYYIDGNRIKTGANYYTPILDPAMEILKKYGYKLPHISDQKCNDYLHLIQALLGFHKSLTFHVARHSFATLVLSHDVPIENVQKMLGHLDVRTTQIYAKVLHTTINRHSEELNGNLRLPKNVNDTDPKDLYQSKTR